MGLCVGVADVGFIEVGLVVVGEKDVGLTVVGVLDGEKDGWKVVGC